MSMYSVIDCYPLPFRPFIVYSLSLYILSLSPELSETSAPFLFNVAIIFSISASLSLNLSLSLTYIPRNFSRDLSVSLAHSQRQLLSIPLSNSTSLSRSLSLSLSLSSSHLSSAFFTTSTSGLSLSRSIYGVKRGLRDIPSRRW